MFVRIENAYAILVSRGVSRQADVYERNAMLYARYGSGFIRLGQRNTTSVDNVRVEEVVLPFKHVMTEVGYLVNPANYTGKTKPAN